MAILTKLTRKQRVINNAYASIKMSQESPAIADKLARYFRKGRSFYLRTSRL